MKKCVKSGSKSSKKDSPFPLANASASESFPEINVEKVFDIMKCEEQKRKIRINKSKISEKQIKTILEKPSKLKGKKPPCPIYCVANSVSDTTMRSYKRAKKFLKSNNILISTITLDCKLHSIIDVDAMAKYLILREDEVVSVKFGDRNDIATNRTIVIIKSKKKPSNKIFYNQITILMKPMNNPERNYINIKVFKNGSLHMTGFKDMDDFNNVSNTLVHVLIRGRDIVKNNHTKHIPFVLSPDKVAVSDTKIRLINSNFKINYRIDRKKLARLLKKNHNKNTKDKEIGYVECKYEPTGGHSCVNIKYQYDATSKPSIFVFQTGAIIITGAKTLDHIVKSYEWIHKILKKYHDEIKIIELDPIKIKMEINKFFRQRERMEKKIANIEE